MLTDSDHPSHTVLARKLQGYLRWRNANARHPDVLAAQRRVPACLAKASAVGPSQTTGRMIKPVHCRCQHTSDNDKEWEWDGIHRRDLAALP